MKILFDHPFPFFLAHGGFQIQIEQTKRALEAIGVEVEFARWWDAAQEGQLIHYFGRPHEGYIEQAQRKGFRVVMGDLLGGLGSRSASHRAAQKFVMTLAQRALPAAFTARLAWRSFAMADACVALTPWEARLMREMFQAPPGKVHVIPNGVERVFLDSAPAATRGQWLVCTATITEVKRVLELAQAAVQAQAPVWIIGRPFHEEQPYARAFVQFARENPRWVRYEGPIQERAALARVYREARGFVLLSSWETLSLSALEAAACGCPLLLSDLPWARSVFGDQAQYCPIVPAARMVDVLRRFHERAPGLPAPATPMSWEDVARALQGIYRGALSTSR